MGKGEDTVIMHVYLFVRVQNYTSNLGHIFTQSEDYPCLSPYQSFGDSFLESSALS